MLVDKDDFLINLLWLLAYNSDIRDNGELVQRSYLHCYNYYDVEWKVS